MNTRKSFKYVRFGMYKKKGPLNKGTSKSEVPPYKGKEPQEGGSNPESPFGKGLALKKFHSPICLFSFSFQINSVNHVRRSSRMGTVPK